MKSRIWLYGFLLAGAPFAFAQDCLLLTCGNDDSCEVTPAQLVASLPPGLQIRSIRGNTKVAFRGEAAVAHCSPSGRLPNIVSADRASLYGALEITGSLKVSGILRYEPNDGGELEFRPRKESFAGTGKFFKANFQRIKLDAAQPPVRVTPPSNLAQADCWQATAKAELVDFAVVIGDSSSAGAYAKQARVVELGRFSKCVWGGE